MATPSHPADLARALGLMDFQTEESKDGKWLRFRFAFPPDEKSPAYRERVERVTAWRKKVAPWLFVGAQDTVAAQLTWWNRFVVGKFNRRNRKALRAYEDPEAVIRRWAVTQPTPQQALEMLKKGREQFGLKGVSTDPETVKLRKLLEQAAALVDGDPETKAHAAKLAEPPPDNVVPLRKAAS